MPVTTAKTINLIVDTSLYPLEAIQAAAYTLTGRAYVRIARSGSRAASVTLKLKAAGGDPTALGDEFHNELLHECLRLKVSHANRKLREYIVTKALVSALTPGTPASAPEPAAEEAACPECAAEAQARAPQTPPAAPVDPELEKEIEKLLREIEKSGPAQDDPLGVAVPWEKKYGAQAKKSPARRKRSTKKPA